MVSSIFYNGDGSTRIFPVSFKILGDDYVRVYVNDVEVVDKTKYDIINNSIVFITSETPAVGTDNVKIYVATSVSELGDLGAPLFDITNVANNIQEIIDVSESLNAIESVNDNEANINLVVANTPNINTVANDISNVNTVADWVDSGFPIVETDDAFVVETVEELSAIIEGYKVAIVKDLNRGGTFIWSATGTANGGTVFAGVSGYWNRQYSGAVNVKWFGAVAGDYTKPITQVMLDNINGTILFDSGTFYAFEKLYIKKGCITNSKSVLRTDYGIFIGTPYVGTVPVPLHRLSISIPDVVPYTTQAVPNTYKAGAGVQITNICNSKIEVGLIGQENGGWENGLLVMGHHGNTSWNNITMSKSHNNRIGVYVTRIGGLGDPLGDGFTNNNLFYIGQIYKKPSDTLDDGSCQIQISDCSGHTFLKSSVEQATPYASGNPPRPGSKYLLKLYNSNQNTFNDVHTESGPKWLNGVSGTVDPDTLPTILLDNSSENKITTTETGSAYYLDVVQINGSKYNWVDRRKWNNTKPAICTTYGTDDSGYEDSRNIIEILPPAVSKQNRNRAVGTDYSIALRTNNIALKRSVTASVFDAHDRILLDGYTGAIKQGSGVYPPEPTIQSFRKTLALNANNTFIAIPSTSTPVYLVDGLNTVNIEYSAISETDHLLYEVGNFKLLLHYALSTGVTTIKQKGQTRFATKFVSSDIDVFTSPNGLLGLKFKCYFDLNSGQAVQAKFLVTVF